MVEVGDLLPQDEVFEQRRAAQPAFSEFWLSAMGTPWLVVSSRPLASTRTRSSGPWFGLRPSGGPASPVFFEAFPSVTVLPVATGSASVVLPGAGWRDASPYSSALFSLYGIPFARAWVPASFRSSTSLDARPARAGPLVVVRETDLAAGAEVRGGLPLLLEPAAEAARPDGGLRVAMELSF